MPSHLPPLEDEGGPPDDGGICGALPRYLLREVAEVITETIRDHGLRLPSATLVLVGRHPTAVSYARSTIAAAKAAGVELQVHELPADAPQAHVAALICKLNTDAACHGIFLQLPLPPHLNGPALLTLLHDDKDVDCLKESSVRRCLVRAEPTVAPCIAAACEEVLRALDILQTPKQNSRTPRAPGPAVLLLGVPALLAFPLELCLEAVGCRISCLPDEQDAAVARAELQRADVIVIGARRPDVVAAQWVRSGSVLLDLGLASATPPSPVGLAALAAQQKEAALDGELDVPMMECDDLSGSATTCHGGNRYRPSQQGVGRTASDNSSASSSSSSDTQASFGGNGSPASMHQQHPGPLTAPTSGIGQPLEASHDLTDVHQGDGLAMAVPLAPLRVPDRTPLEAWEFEQRDVLCICCSDGIAAMTAALRMRNLAHAALLQQGFIESETEKDRSELMGMSPVLPPALPSAMPPSF